MKHLAIFCVNYNSYGILDKYLRSIDDNAICLKETAKVDVFIADNTVDNIKTIQTAPYKGISRIQLFSFHKNLGYFKAIYQMMLSVDTGIYDYVIISNVDMTLRPDTLSNLVKSNYPQNTGWIAPAIIAKESGKDLNPQAVTRYTATKLRIMRWFYRIPMAYNIYLHTFHILRRKQMQRHEPGQIYAGHGSFIILTKEYMSRCGIIDFPIFLYCEEIYIAEECLRHELNVVYDPSIAIDDIGKVSTGKAKKSLYYQWNIEGLTYVLDKYFI